MTTGKKQKSKGEVEMRGFISGMLIGRGKRGASEEEITKGWCLYKTKQSGTADAEHQMAEQESRS